MSQLFVEKISFDNNTVSTSFTSSVFTALPFWMPIPFPPPLVRYRISFNGDSTSTLANLIVNWRLLANTTQINTFTSPSNKFNLGGVYPFAPANTTSTTESFTTGTGGTNTGSVSVFNSEAAYNFLNIGWVSEIG